MATKQMIVAISLMTAVLLAEARSAIQGTPKSSRANFAFHKNAQVPDAESDVNLKDTDPDTDLTTVREFYFIMIMNEEIVAVELHAFQKSQTSRQETWLTLRRSFLFNSAYL